MANKQPSNTMARNEVLIILDYLLHECDEKHLSKQNDIIKYARVKYKVRIKRQRVSDALFDLKCFSDEYKDFLPFEVKEICTGKRYKYYARIKKLSKNEIDTILNAIRNDRYIGYREYMHLNNKLLSLITSRYDADEFRTNLKNNIELDSINKSGIYSRETLAKAKDAIKNKKCVTIDVKNIDNIKLEKSIISNEHIFNCYFYKIIRFHDIDYVVGVINISDTWFSIPVNDIEIIKSEAFVDDISNYNYNDHFKAPDGYNTIEEYLKVHLLPYDDKVIKVCFRILDRKKTFAKINKSFKSHFNKTMGEYPVYDRILKRKIDEVEFETQAKLFKEWILSDLFILNNIQLVYPKTLVDELINSFENVIYHLKCNRSKYKEESEYTISLFKYKMDRYVYDSTPIYSESFIGTYEDANAYADKLMKQYDAELKMVENKDFIMRK